MTLPNSDRKSASSSTSEELSVEIAHLLEQTARLIDEISRLNLNLSVAHARLRLDNPVFQTLEQSFRDLLDRSVNSQERAEAALRRARGEKLSDDEKTIVLNELDDNLDKIRIAAENIIGTINLIRKGQRFDAKI